MPKTALSGKLPKSFNEEMKKTEKGGQEALELLHSVRSLSWEMDV